MCENYHGANYELAKAEADKVDEKIIEALRDGHSFRVEAGAGSGKTYSLNRVIEWIQENMWSKYSRKKQNVVCITYTNAAVEVITERLSKDSFIIPSTIHSFAWNAIKQYQSYLVDVVTTDPDFLPDESDFFKVNAINEQISNFAQTYPTNLKASSNEALLFMRRYRFANCSCFSCCFKDAYPSSNVQ